MIPKILIERLAPYGNNRYIKVEAAKAGNKKSGKRAIDPGFQLTPRAPDDPSLIKHLEDGGNYGVLAGKGVIVVDLDVKNALSLPATFAVASGGGKGSHLYYRSNIDDNATVSKGDDHIADIQARYKYVVGPGCGHHSGGTYKIIDDRPLEWLDADALEAVVDAAKCALNWALKVRKEIDEAAGEETSLLGRDIPIEKLPGIDLSKLTQRGDDEWQGEHPTHGSTTGQNFAVNVEKNCWHCFRHSTGGGPLSWLAVEEGIIACEEAKPGALTGDNFRAAKKAAEKLGYTIEFLPDTVAEGDAKQFFRGKTFKPSLLGDAILGAYPTITVGGYVFIYDRSEGIYIEKGEPWLRSIAARMLGESYKSGRISEVVKYIMDMSIRKELPETRPESLVVANGLLNVLTRELRPFAPEEFHVAGLPTEFDPSAVCPTWMRCLGEWLPEDKILMLQEYLGYTLYRAYPFPKAGILHGITRSGKTTVIRAWTFVLGKKNVSVVRLRDLTENKFAGADLFGKMMNSTGELDEAEIRNTANFKAVTGRDPIRVERKGQDGFDIYPYAKLLYGTNELPRISAKENEAFFIRIILIRFTRQFLGKDADVDLDDKLKAEASGMLNWGLEGLQRLMARGCFEESQDTTEMKEDYLIQGDPFEYFWQNYVEQDYQCAITRAHFAEVFDAFCKAHRAPMMTPNETLKRMRDKEVKEKNQRIEEEQARVWMGIKWRESVASVAPIAPFWLLLPSPLNEKIKRVMLIEDEKTGKRGNMGNMLDVGTMRGTLQRRELMVYSICPRCGDIFETTRRRKRRRNPDYPRRPSYSYCDICWPKYQRELRGYAAYHRYLSNKPPTSEE